jgi:hypothetical protein
VFFPGSPSHILSTQIRWAASDISIWRSLVADPLLSVGILCWFSGFVTSWWGLAVRFLHPKVTLKLILGHWYMLWFHASYSSLQIRLAVPCMQPTMICSINSIPLHVLHVPQSPYSGIWNHTSPTIGVLWVALKRYCCMHSCADGMFPYIVPYCFVGFEGVLVLMDCCSYCFQIPVC